MPEAKGKTVIIIERNVYFCDQMPDTGYLLKKGALFVSVWEAERHSSVPGCVICNMVGRAVKAWSEAREHISS